MSSTPLTPAKTPVTRTIGLHTSSSGTSDMPGKRHSLSEPSPASTFGETPSASSQAATPLDTHELGHGSQQGVLLSSINEHDLLNLGSPTSIKVPPYRLPMIRQGLDHRHTISTGRLAIDNVKPTIPEQRESIFEARAKDHAFKPREQDFVVKTDASQVDDIFGPTTPIRLTQSANGTPTKGGFATLSTHVTPTSNADGEISVEKETPSKHTPRVDRLQEKPSADNAQGLFTPDACVFVANLSTGCADSVLESAVNHAFSQFGSCYTKIRRDHKNMPFAFVQYESQAVATKAIREGRGLPIEGRKCRTEVARAARSLMVSRNDGTAINIDEVTAILTKFGAIEEDFRPTVTETELFGLPRSGQFFRFAFFQDCLDAAAALRNHPVYRFEQRGEPQAEIASRRANRMNTPTGVQDPAAVRRPSYTSSRTASSTIFVGNVPSEVNWRVLTDIFGAHGNIVSCQITVNMPPNDHTGDNQVSTNTFAYVEFSHQSSAMAAVSAQDGKRTSHTGHLKLRVRLQHAGPYPGRQTMHHRTPAVGQAGHGWAMPSYLATPPHSAHGCGPSVPQYASSMGYYDPGSVSPAVNSAGFPPSNFPQYGQPYFGPPGLYGTQGAYMHGQHVMPHGQS